MASPSDKFTADTVEDRLFEFLGGVNMGVDPELIAQTQLSLAVNATVRGGLINHRPAYNTIPLTFVASSGLTALQVQTGATTGLFQGACYYQPDSGLESLIAAIGGRLYKFQIIGGNCTVTDVTGTGFAANPATTTQAWLWQSERWVIWNDGQSIPIIFDGVKCRRSNSGYEGISVIGIGVQTAAQAGFINVGNTIPSDGGAYAVTLDKNCPIAAGGWITIKGNVYVVITGTGAAAITIKNLDGVTRVVAIGDSWAMGTTGPPGGSNTNVVGMPPIGSSVAIGLGGAPAAKFFNQRLRLYYRGSVDGKFLVVGDFLMTPYNPPPGPTPNAVLKNLADVAGNTVGFGTSIIQTSTSGQWQRFAGLISNIGDIRQDEPLLPNGATITIDIDAPYNGGNNTHILIGSDVVLVTAGTGTSHITIHNDSGHTVFEPRGANVFQFINVTTVQTVGVLSQSFTVPAIGATVNVVLNVPYNGPDLTDVTINGVAYQISPYTITPSSATVLLTNLTISDVTGRYFQNNPSAYHQLQTVPEVPVGRMGAYVMGRNWMALHDGRSYWASDQAGGSSGTAVYSYRDAVLRSTENNTINGGGSFTVPGSPSGLSAIIGTAQLDTSLGQGPLAVLTPLKVFSNNAPSDRTTWQNLGFPIQTVSLSGAGAVGQNSTVAAHGDTIMRSLDGIRSLVMARRDFNVWGNVPISREVGPLLASDSTSLLQYGSAVVFDNRMIMTRSPSQGTLGVYHAGLVVLDFDPLSGLHNKSPAVWEGGWQDLNVLQLLTGTFQGVSRAFAFNFNQGAGTIELWELLSTGAATQDNGNTPIVWRAEFPQMDFGFMDHRHAPLLSLRDGEIYIDNMIGPVRFQTYYQPDEYPLWIPWLDWTETPSPSITPNFRPRMGLGEPSASSVDVSTNRPTRDGYRFQFAIVVTGHCQLRGARFRAVKVPQPQFAPPNPSGIAG